MQTSTATTTTITFKSRQVLRPGHIDLNFLVVEYLTILHGGGWNSDVDLWFPVLKMSAHHSLLVYKVIFPDLPVPDLSE